MTARSTTWTPAGPAVIDGGFARVVCGIDGTRGGYECARQAARITAPAGRLVLVGVATMLDALAGRWGAEAPRWRIGTTPERTLDQCMEDLRARVRLSLASAGEQVTGPGDVTSRVVDGDIDTGLFAAGSEADATLMAVGAHGGRRLVEALLAEVSAIVLHDAPVSVLLTRPSFDPGRFPAHIVVGVDGSAESRAALHAAATLRDRSGGTLTVVTAGRDQSRALDALDGLDTPHEHVATADRPVDALVVASRTADLTIVGSRGLHGRSALGSVSERVAFRAESSVLVVRLPTGT